MIVDGRALAKEVLVRAKARAQMLPHPPRVIAYVAQNPTAATRSYLNIKKRSAEAAGCVFEETNDPAGFDDADAFIIQLPLPEGADTKAMCDAIPIEKDADVLSAAARADGHLLPPVVGAVKETLEFGNIGVVGKRAVVIGAGFLVGAPVSAWLTQQGAEVEIVTLESGNISMLKEADIIVSGAGSPHFIKPEMLKDGVVLIDAGASESGGALAGDVDPSCADKCSIFTPVPGGVGPLAVAKLFENVVTLTERAIHK